MSVFKDLSNNDIRELLKTWREKNERNSQDVFDLWENVIEGDCKKLGNDKHVILEQVIYAALDCHYYGIANACIYLLSKDFPHSLRVMRHQAACLEAEEKYEQALQVIDAIIKADETNAPARKRRVAILKAQGLIPEAIKELVDYLKKFMADVEGWQELCELYLQMHEYSRAAFCAEELILHQPFNHLMHQRLADIRYTMGGVENMEIAKSYYCQALKLNPDNIRALLGLFLVTNNLLNHYKSSGSSKRKEVWKLSQWAQAKIALKQQQAQDKAETAPELTTAVLALAISD